MRDNTWLALLETYSIYKRAIGAPIFQQYNAVLPVFQDQLAVQSTDGWFIMLYLQSAHVQNNARRSVACQCAYFVAVSVRVCPSLTVLVSLRPNVTTSSSSSKLRPD